MQRWCHPHLLLMSWILPISSVQQDRGTIQTVHLAMNETALKKGNSVAQSSPVNFCRVLNSIRTQQHKWKPWRLGLSHVNLASWLSAAAGLRAAAYHEAAAAAAAAHLLAVSHASASREKHNAIRAHRQRRYTNVLVTTKVICNIEMQVKETSMESLQVGKKIYISNIII